MSTSKLKERVVRHSPSTGAGSPDVWGIYDTGSRRKVMWQQSRPNRQPRVMGRQYWFLMCANRANWKPMGGCPTPCMFRAGLWKAAPTQLQ